MENDKQVTPAVETPATTTSEANKGGNSTETKKTFTQEEVNEILQKRLAEEKPKTDKAIQEAVNTGIAEYERKAKLSQEEKDKEERTKKQAEMESREREITLRERRIEAKDMLINKHIPIELVDFVVDIDESKTKDNVENLAKCYNKSVEDGVTSKLKGTPIEDFSNSNSSADAGVKTPTTAF